MEPRFSQVLKKKHRCTPCTYNSGQSCNCNMTWLSHTGQDNEALTGKHRGCFGQGCVSRSIASTCVCMDQ
jgi:hypothetical protein